MDLNDPSQINTAEAIRKIEFPLAILATIGILFFFIKLYKKQQ